VSRADVGFIGLPDGSLAHHEGEIERQIRERARAVRASTVLVPFRYDRHPDHIAVNRAATAARRDGMAAELFEYFVYTKWRMLATGDVRDYVRGDDLFRVHTAESARLKRAALDRHRSQTTLYFRRQRRPILTGLLLDEACAEPEAFLRHRPEFGGRRALARGQYWVPLACKLEPALKRLKDRLAGERVQ
jgi:LmbE family N-acetylglucosaminyl deacetylase